MFSSPGQCHFVWSSVRSRKVRRVMDCGGKRSATPLSHAWKASASSRVLVRAKAPSPLPLCRRTPRRFAPLALPPPIRRRLGARRAGRRGGKIRARPRLGGKTSATPIGRSDHPDSNEKFLFIFREASDEVSRPAGKDAYPILPNTQPACGPRVGRAWSQFRIYTPARLRLVFSQPRSCCAAEPAGSSRTASAALTLPASAASAPSSMARNFSDSF